MARSNRKVRVGRVISNKMDKTATVEVTRTYQHTRFKRVVRRRKKYLVHDVENTLNAGEQYDTRASESTRNTAHAGERIATKRTHCKQHN